MVVTIHDLAYKLFPETAHPEVVQRYDRLAQAEKNANLRVIAVSQTTKQDILNLTNIDPVRCTGVMGLASGVRDCAQ